MTDLDPRTALWRAVAALALLRRQLQILAASWEALPPADPGDAYDVGSSDAFAQAAHELRDLLEPR